MTRIGWWAVVVSAAVVASVWLTDGLSVTKTVLGAASVGIAAGTLGAGIERIVDRWRSSWL